MKGVLRFGRKSKLSPRFIRLFEILVRTRPVAYRLALPQSLSAVHNVFHVSILRKYLANPTHVIDSGGGRNLSYEERPVRILEREVQTLRARDIAFVKALRRNEQIISCDLRKKKYYF